MNFCGPWAVCLTPGDCYMCADARLIISLKLEYMSCACFHMHDKYRSKCTEKSNKSNADLDPFHPGSSLMCSHTSCWALS